MPDQNKEELHPDADETAAAEENVKADAKTLKKAEKAKKKKSGREGRRVRSLSPMSYVAVYIMKDRNDATNYYADRIEISHTEEYIRQKKEEGKPGFNLMYVILAAYVRTLATHPEANRFIRGQKIYARNCIEVMLTIKLEMKRNAPDTVLKVIFPPDATADDIYRIMNETIETARSGQTSFDGLAKAINIIPGVLLRGTVGFLKFLDYFGLLPRKLTKLSPFHGSLAITSMGSLRIRPIYHHLYNFGNIPAFIAFGTSYTELEPQSDGSTAKHKYVDLKFCLDERIMDGYGYASVLHCLKHLLQNPFALDEKPKEIIEDIP
ncbi:MAG: hypothetical protein IKS34_03810 [Clostridia bacterium]|nr:hypothetical protein [Clostridia bacterium]